MATVRGPTRTASAVSYSAEGTTAASAALESGTVVSAVVERSRSIE